MNKGFYKIQSKSFTDYGVSNHKDLWEKVKADGYKGITVAVKTDFTKSVESNYYHAIFSSANEDRHGDIVMQVFDLKGFMRNPVYLDSHNYDSIEHIIGKIHNIAVIDGSLQGDVEFAIDNPKGALAEKLVEKGFLSASSIGFIPKAFSDDGRMLESELLEISAVSVPANADAIFEKKEEVKEVKEIKEVKPKISLAKIVANISKQKDEQIKMIGAMVKKMIMDGDKKQARKLHQVIRELSK